MIDLHTHILCGVDDGAVTAGESLKLLRMERNQGVTAVALTPHFYWDRESPQTFLEKRATAFDRLQDRLQDLDSAERDSLPELFLGAEVAWSSHMAAWDHLEQLCIQGTKNMLLELPFAPWHENLSRQIRDFMNQTGIMPILVHLERYFPLQKKRQLREIISLGLPIQISSTPFLHQTTRRTVMNALKDGWAHMVCTDCHDPAERKPDLKEAMEVIRKKFGDDMVQKLQRHSLTMLE